MPSGYTTVSRLQYDAVGQVKTKSLGGRKLNDSTYSPTPLEEQYYEYNVRGWLLGVNRVYARDAVSTDSITTTVTTQTIGGEMFTEGVSSLATVTYPNTHYFGFDLGYDKTANSLINGKGYAAPQYTGNISGMTWKGANDRKVRMYDFCYDNVNRLTGARFGQYAIGGFSSANLNYSVDNLSYDHNGNILTMRQNGLTTGSSSAPIDKLRYTYYSNTNRLKNVIDTANDAASLLGDFHYPSMAKTVATVDYTYDANGNMISDGNKNISSIVYNYLNLPEVITVAGKGRISYSYDVAGNKLRKETVESTQTPNSTTTLLYIGNSVYRNDTLEFFGTGEGWIRPYGTNTAFVYDYFLKDHLGNTRMVITDDYNVASPILEATSYYPFGLQQKGIGLEASGRLHNKYLFNGKEEQSNEFSDGSGLEAYDFGKRFQDPQLDVWHNIDPRADKMTRYSPYAYAFDNPIRFIDADGMAPDDVVFYNRQGQEIYRVQSNTVFRTYILGTDKAGNQTYTEASMPNIIQSKGRENTSSAEYQQNDYQIAASTKIFNMDKADGTLELWTDGNQKIPTSSLTQIPDLDPTTVKAVAMQESGAGTDPSMNGTSDVMQVNNGVNHFEDYADYKAHYGLNDYTVPDPGTSINAGIKDLGTKGFKGGVTYDSKTGTSTYTFQGWNSAISNINGGGAAKYGQDYLGAILEMIKDAQKPQANNY